MTSVPQLRQNLSATAGNLSATASGRVTWQPRSECDPPAEELNWEPQGQKSPRLQRLLVRVWAGQPRSHIYWPPTGPHMDCWHTCAPADLDHIAPLLRYCGQCEPIPKFHNYYGAAVPCWCPIETRKGGLLVFCHTMDHVRTSASVEASNTVLATATEGANN